MLAWAVERPDGGRGFGFTGAHTHKNWGDPNFRKLVLNAILWTAKLDVPSEGVESHVTERGAEAEPRSQEVLRHRRQSLPTMPVALFREELRIDSVRLETQTPDV